MQAFSRDKPHDSKLSLIAEDQTPFVVEIENSVRVFWQFIICVQIKKLARHAEMYGKNEPLLTRGLLHRGSSPTPGSPTEHLGWGGAVRKGVSALRALCGQDARAPGE